MVASDPANKAKSVMRNRFVRVQRYSFLSGAFCTVHLCHAHIIPGVQVIRDKCIGQQCPELGIFRVGLKARLRMTVYFEGFFRCRHAQ